MVELRGRIKFFNQVGFYGFVFGDDGREYFFHASVLCPEKNPVKDEIVFFEYEIGRRGLNITRLRFEQGEFSELKAKYPK